MSETQSKYRVGPLKAEEPPPKVMRTSVTAEILALVPQMKQQPKRWFRVAEFTDKRRAVNVRSNVAKQVPQCEWVSRQAQDGSAIWGRWIGNGHKEDGA